MDFSPLPQAAAWRHHDARSGFEVVFLAGDGDGPLVEGACSAVEDGEAWAVAYEVTLDPAGRTRSARVRSRSAQGGREITLLADGAGHWTVDGVAAPTLDGCLDVDLEASAFTNAFPTRRLALEVGAAAEAPAAYVRALDLAVERLEQRYARLPDGDGRRRYHYTSPAFAFEAELTYDEAGLVIDYPGIAVRVA